MSTATASNKPKLPQLATPVSGTFPSETVMSAAATPLSAKPNPLFHDLSARTPISPPTAYTDFLRGITLHSPAPSRSSPSGETTPDSLPSTASSEQTDCSCKCESPHKESIHKMAATSASASAAGPTAPPATAPAVPPSPFTQLPLPISAPPNGAASFPSLKIPPSPAYSLIDSPMSATPNTARSPFSARSVQSVFDWDAALKARYCDKKKPSRTSVRHIREVVTRTVTYNPTPRMNPAPKGKRRKVEHTSASPPSTTIAQPAPVSTTVQPPPQPQTTTANTPPSPPQSTASPPTS